MQENICQWAVIRNMKSGKLQFSESSSCACTSSTNTSSCLV